MNPFKAFTSIRLVVIFIVLGRFLVQGDHFHDNNKDNVNSDTGPVTKLTQILRPMMQYAELSENSVETEEKSRNQFNRRFDDKLNEDKNNIYEYENDNVAKEKEKNQLIIEGRGKKDDNMGLPFLIGYKTATAVTMMFGFMKMLVFKALLVAKIALALSAMLTFYKLFEGGSNVGRHSAFMEIEHHASDHAPVYMEFPNTGNGVGYHPSSSGNYYAYSNYIPSGNAGVVAAGGGAGAVVAETQNYATVETSAGTTTNGSNANQNQQAAGNISKRRSSGGISSSDLKRKPNQISSPTIITVKRITKQS